MTNPEQPTCPHGYPLHLRAECPECKRLLEIYQNPDYETLYRYENPEIPYDERREGSVSKKELVGSWFTNKTKDLAGYIRMRQPGGRILLVRVPKSDLENYDATTHPETRDMDIEVGNYVIPQDIRERSQLDVPLTVESSSPKKFQIKDWDKVNQFVETQLKLEQLFSGMSLEKREDDNEEEIEDGLGILIKRKTLYHGSATSGISQLDKAGEDTVGSGVYFTSKKSDGEAYAKIRHQSDKGQKPILYTAEIEDTKLLDLRKDENVAKILEGFAQVLQKKLSKPDLQWFTQHALRERLNLIRSGKVKANNLKHATQAFGQWFAEYVQSLGYDGLIAMEGGEGEMSSHDTYLIIDPSKAKIKQEGIIE